MSRAKKALVSSFRRLRTKSEKAPKKVARSQKNDPELIQALCPQIEDVASALCRRKVISERKEEHIMCLPGRSIKAQFLMDVLNRKGQDAMTALYQVARNFQLWQAADILEPHQAPHGPRPVPIVTSPRRPIDDVDGPPVRVPTARKVSFHGEADDMNHRHTAGAMNGTFLMSQAGDILGHIDRPDKKAENESEGSDCESGREDCQEGKGKVFSNDESNDASSEDSDPGRGDKSDTHPKTRVGETKTGIAKDAFSEDSDPSRGDKSDTHPKTHIGEMKASVANDASNEDSDPGHGDESDIHPQTHVGETRASGEITPQSRRSPGLTSIFEKQTEENTEKGTEFLKSPCIRIEKRNSKWVDVGGLQHLKKHIQEAQQQTMFFHKFPHVNKDPQSPMRNVLLYGPDTDMTFVVRAIAKQVGCSCIISVTLADLESIWTDERLMKAVFEHARSQQQCIILISDVDLLSTSESQSIAQIRRECLKQITNEMTDDNLLVFGTTKKPWAVDSSIKQKFRKELYIRVPDSSLSVEIFREWFQGIMGLGFTPEDTDLEELARAVHGYSRTQINAVLDRTLMEAPLRKIRTATHFRQASGPSRENPSEIVDDLWTPCNPGAPGARDMNWTEIPGNKLLEPIPTKDCPLLEQALAHWLPENPTMRACLYGDHGQLQKSTAFYMIRHQGRSLTWFTSCCAAKSSLGKPMVCKLFQTRQDISGHFMHELHHFY